MGKIAFVFAGQGAQYSGMGKSLYETSEKVKEIYDMAERIRPGTKAQSFEGDAEELKQTKNTQPCLYLVDLCSAVALNECGIYADEVAGFSLGEIAALAYAGAYSYEDGFKIVEKRGIYMQESAEKADTGMTAVIKVPSDEIEKVCGGIDGVYAVNYNSDAQTVVAGLKEKLPEFKEKIAALGGKCIDLAVGGGFHSPFMNEASEKFCDEVQGFDMKAPEIPVYANMNAEPYGDNVKEILPKQITNPVRWLKTVENMIENGVTTFIEVGAGKTLSGLIKKISKDVTVLNVQDAESLAETVKAVKENG